MHPPYNEAAARALAVALERREGMMARAVSGAQAPFPGIRARVGALALCAVAFALVAGCSEPGNGSGATRAAVSSGLADGAPRAIERDVEAPEIFSMEEAGLWDGRPSLGGVWVAHPEASEPERVMIRNAQTGETVVGALFRRERENPGPRFQISSEAANALDILPGQPTTIRVVALQLQQVEPEAEREEERPEEQPTAEAAPEEEAVPEVETTEERAEEVALAEARDDDAARVEPEPETAHAEAEDGADTEAEEPTQRRGLRALFSRRSSSSDVAPDATSSHSAPDAAMAPPSQTGAEPEPRAETGAEAPAGERRGLGRLFSRSGREEAPEEDEIRTATLIPTPEQDSGQDAAPQPDGGSLDQPFVQIGIFSVESNANAARAQMQQAGLSAEIRRGRMDDNRFWRVIVGPAQDSAGRAAMLDQVRELGFDDAYAVAR